MLKAQYVSEKFGFDCFADDTGLEVDALDGQPGVYSARFAGDGHNSIDNMNKVLTLLGENPNRTARFRTVIALILNGKISFFEGKIEGTITSKPRGNSGFGYDPIFVPQNYMASFAQLSAEEKNKISHRAKALAKLKSFFTTK